MKKKVFVLICCALVILLFALYGVFGMKQRTADGVTRCLLVGCDRFVSMPGTEPASANNVDTMEALLADFLPEGTEISRQVNGPGSTEGFRQLAADTFREAKQADTSLIYLSTHGVLKTEAEEQEMFLLLSDGETEGKLSPEEFRNALEKIPGRKIGRAHV